MTEHQRSWRLEGFDTFESEYYSIPGEYESEADAQAAGRDRLRELEKLQPTSSSGGQGFYGIQDRVLIVSPEGKRRRF